MASCTELQLITAKAQPDDPCTAAISDTGYTEQHTETYRANVELPLWLQRAPPRSAGAGGLQL